MKSKVFSIIKCSRPIAGDSGNQSFWGQSEIERNKHSQSIGRFHKPIDFTFVKRQHPTDCLVMSVGDAGDLLYLHPVAGYLPGPNWNFCFLFHFAGGRSAGCGISYIHHSNGKSSFIKSGCSFEAWVKGGAKKIMATHLSCHLFSSGGKKPQVLDFQWIFKFWENISENFQLVLLMGD